MKKESLSCDNNDYNDDENNKLIPIASKRVLFPLPLGPSITQTPSRKLSKSTVSVPVRWWKFWQLLESREILKSGKLIIFSPETHLSHEINFLKKSVIFLPFTPIKSVIVRVFSVASKSGPEISSSDGFIWCFTTSVIFFPASKSRSFSNI